MESLLFLHQNAFFAKFVWRNLCIKRGKYDRRSVIDREDEFLGEPMSLCERADEFLGKPMNLWKNLGAHSSLHSEIRELRMIALFQS